MAAPTIIFLTPNKVAGLREKKPTPVGVQRNTMQFRTNPLPNTQSTALPAGGEQDTRPGGTSLYMI
eukprot:8011555-Heterocapsa_arctica.AAC.2